MKNIGFVIHSLGSGGAERVLSTLANHLSNSYNIFIITFVDIEPFYELDERIKVVHCEGKIEPSSSPFQALKLNFILYRKLSQFSKSLCLDLLIGFMTQANVLTILSAKTNRLPVIISERIYPKYNFTSKLWKFLRRVTYPLTTKLVVQTKPIQEYYESFVVKNKIRIVENPIAKSYTDLSSKIKITEKENIILNVGRLNQQKGQEIAIQAFAQLNTDDWYLYLVGEGPKRKEYEELIKQFGVQDNVKLLGRMKDVSRYYLKSKLFVFPSRFEGFPNALAEAMYMGLPCISANCPTGPAELIKNNHNGFLVPIDDVMQFKQKMAELIENESLRNKLGENAKLSVSYLEEENILKQWRELINCTLDT